MSHSAPSRLRRSSDVAAARRHGSKFVGRHVVVWVRRRDDGQGIRMTAVASRAAGTAVQRNRAKRCLREAGRQVSWPRDADVVLQARRTTAEAGTTAIARELVAMDTGR